MRLSVDNGDLGWDVWLDGVLQRCVVMADDVTGEVKRYRADDFFGQTETVRGKVEIRPVARAPKPEPAKVQGLVAPTWSDSGEVPVGEVTYTFYDMSDSRVQEVVKELMEPKPSDPNAKPSMPSLSKVAGESYRGLGWCDE